MAEKSFNFENMRCKILKMRATAQKNKQKYKRTLVLSEKTDRSVRTHILNIFKNENHDSKRMYIVGR
jgi:hypothetical protein